MITDDEHGNKCQSEFDTEECDHDQLAMESDHNLSSSNEAKESAGPRNGDAKRSKANKRKYAGSYMYNVRFDVKWLERNDCRGELKLFNEFEDRVSHHMDLTPSSSFDSRVIILWDGYLSLCMISTVPAWPFPLHCHFV